MAYDEGGKSFFFYGIFYPENYPIKTGAWRFVLPAWHLPFPVVHPYDYSVAIAPGGAWLIRRAGFVELCRALTQIICY